MPSFSNTLEQAIHAALALANARRHEFATLEHLLLALVDEPDASRVLKACSVETEELRTTLVEFIDNDVIEMAWVESFQMGFFAECLYRSTKDIHRPIALLTHVKANAAIRFNPQVGFSRLIKNFFAVGNKKNPTGTHLNGIKRR